MQVRTLVILKPDCVARGLIGRVNSMIENVGLRIVAQKMILMTKEQTEEFYDLHRSKKFFPDLCGCMTSGPIVVQLIQGFDAITLMRKLIGHTNPENALPNTIRGLYGISIDRNTIHASDSQESVDKETSLLFKSNEIFDI